MMASTLLLAAALGVWGYGAHHEIIAALLAAALLLPVLLRLKFALEDRELCRAADLSSLFTGGAFLYFLATMPVAQAVFAVAGWLPASLFPVLLAAHLGRQPVRRRHLFYSLRRSSRPGAQREVALPPLYLAATLLAAAVSTPAGAWFYPCLFVALVGWLVFILPAPRLRRSLPFVACAALAGAAGFLGAGGLQQLQQLAQDWYVDQLGDDDEALSRSQTRIGDLGNIKLSDRIVWRVDLPAATPLPLLLRDGIFTHFDGQAWTARHEGFKPFKAAGDEGELKLEIRGNSRKQQVLLPLPQGVRRIEAATAIEQNGYGIVHLKEAPDWLHVRVSATAADDMQVPPSPADLLVNPHLRKLFTSMPAIAGLAGQSEAEKVHGLEAWFAREFRYTLALGKGAGQNRDLRRFLLDDKAGHCEYFATATVLLLRHLGIPARYVTGYSLQEYSPLEKRHVARQRHAHAWAEAWIGGRWRDVDTTPAEWLAVEEQTAAWWQPVSDWFSWIWLRYTEWRLHRSGDSGWLGLWWLLPVVLAIVVIGRRLWQRRIRKAPARPPAETAPDEAASRLQALEREFAALGYARTPSEPPRRWLLRIGREAAGRIEAERLETARMAIDRHYRRRYYDET